MAVILENRSLVTDVFLMRLSGVPLGSPGQFVQVHLPEASGLLLPRPISICDIDGEAGQTSLVYRVVGRGTKLLSQLAPGTELRITGPLGNGFPLKTGDATLIGGGLGIAPLLFLIKALRGAEPKRQIRLALGYSDRVFLKEALSAFADTCVVNVGGYVTEDVDFSKPGTYYACGPAPMMQAAYRGAAKQERELYVSLESRMACGVGACFSCSIETASGNRRVCKDGPVFPAKEVYVWTNG